ncbi:MAG: hypothetical protein KC944_09435 [Candidatus Omnitrophica bacterium]|nr:hypothetical protein [Candidatus Omnitrophota bacterium]
MSRTRVNPGAARAKPLSEAIDAGSWLWLNPERVGLLSDGGGRLGTEGAHGNSSSRWIETQAQRGLKAIPTSVKEQIDTNPRKTYIFVEMLSKRIAAFLLCLALPTHAATLLVSKSGDGSDGQSWPTAYTEIGAAITASSTGDEIWVATGVYVENIVIGDPLTILGGFPSDETFIDRNSQDPETYSTIIDGSREGSVVIVRDECMLSGLTIQNGLARYGSGLNAVNCHITLENVRILSNGTKESGTGGGIFADRCDSKLMNCFLARNSSTDGGGIHAREGRLTLISSELRDNIGGGGGGVFINTGTAEITSTAFIQNDGRGRGGGFYATTDSFYTIDPCLFERNMNTVPPTPRPFTPQYWGGGIFSRYSKGTISNSLFVRNMSRYGSIISLQDTEPNDVVFRNCTIDIFTGAFHEGVWWEFGSPPKFVNCIFVTEDYPYFFPIEDIDVTYSLVERGFAGEGNLRTFPKFVDRENGDYRLMRNSPCIDAGTDTGLAEDYDGNPRPIGRYDVGAYEFPTFRGDIDGDGAVDDKDLMLLTRDWQKVSGP